MSSSRTSSGAAQFRSHLPSRARSGGLRGRPASSGARPFRPCLTGARLRGRLGKKAHRRTGGCAGRCGHGRSPQEPLCRAGAGGASPTEQRGAPWETPSRPGPPRPDDPRPYFSRGRGSSNGLAPGFRPGPGATAAPATNRSFAPFPFGVLTGILVMRANARRPITVENGRKLPAPVSIERAVATDVCLGRLRRGPLATTRRIRRPFVLSHPFETPEPVTIASDSLHSTLSSRSPERVVGPGRVLSESF